MDPIAEVHINTTTVVWSTIERPSFIVDSARGGEQQGRKIVRWLLPILFIHVSGRNRFIIMVAVPLRVHCCVNRRYQNSALAFDCCWLLPLLLPHLIYNTIPFRAPPLPAIEVKSFPPSLINGS